MRLDLIRLVACDIGGTLAPTGGLPSRRTVEALRQCLELGLHVALVTGRRKRGAEEVARIIGDEVFVVACDGAVVSHPGSGRVLAVEAIPGPRCQEAVAIIQSGGCSVFLHLARDEAPRVIYRTVGGSRTAAKYAASLGADGGPLELHFSPGISDVVKINALGPLCRIQQIGDALGLPGDAVSAPGRGEAWMQMVAEGVDKGAGLAALTRHLRIGPGEVLAFGDGPNDLAMFDFAGMSVAVGSARGDVAARADCVTGGSDGVAEFLLRNLLTGGR